MERKLLQAQSFNTEHFPLMIILGSYCRHKPYAAPLMNKFSMLPGPPGVCTEGNQCCRTLLNCVHWGRSPNSLNSNAKVTWSCPSVLDSLTKSLWLSSTEVLILSATRAGIRPLILCLLCVSVLGPVSSNSARENGYITLMLITMIILFCSSWLYLCFAWPRRWI